VGSISNVGMAGRVRPTEGPFPTAPDELLPTPAPLTKPPKPGSRNAAPPTPFVQYVSQTGDLSGKSLAQQTTFFNDLLSRAYGPRTISVELLSAGDPAAHQLTMRAVESARRMHPSSRVKFEALMSGMKPAARTCLVLQIPAEQTTAHNADLRATASPVIQKRALAAIATVGRSSAFDTIAIDDHALFTAGDLDGLSKVTGQTVPQLQLLSLANLTQLVANIKRFGKTPTMSVGGVGFTQSATGLSNAAFIRRVGLAEGVYEVQLYTEKNASLGKALQSLMREARADPSAFGSLKGLRVALAAEANRTRIGPRQLREQQKMVAEFARDFFETTGVQVSTALWDGARYLAQMKGAQQVMRQTP
jgi:hypothetical protein